MRQFLIIAAFMLVGVYVVSAEPQYGVCQTQLEADVGSRFQQTVTQIEFTFITTEGGKDGGGSTTAVVYTNTCSGYHVYDVYATDYDCRARAHYGARNYIRYRASGGGC